MILTTLKILIPLFFVIGSGFIFSKIFKISEDTIVRLVTDFFMPLLVFGSLYRTTNTPNEVLNITGATIFVIVFLLVVSIIYAKIFRIDLRYFIPPIIFMNSGFLGIPLMQLWGGNLPMNIIVIYDQIQTFMIFTLGILIVTGGFSLVGLKEMLKSPLLWAIVLGFTFKFTNIHLSQIILKTVDFAGTPAPALAAFAVGCSLSNRKTSWNIHLFSGIIFRFVLGFLAGYLAVKIFNITGTLKTVIIVASSLPAAVLSYVLPVRYGVKADLPSSMVLTTSILSIITIPLAFYLTTLFP